jgi:hypothetical protein
MPIVIYPPISHMMIALLKRPWRAANGHGCGHEENKAHDHRNIFLGMIKK